MSHSIEKVALHTLGCKLNFSETSTIARDFSNKGFSLIVSKKIKEHKAMVSALKRGDDVVTAGGIVGKVEKVLGNDKVELQISENVTVEVVQSTISSLLNKPNTKK